MSGLTPRDVSILTDLHVEHLKTTIRSLHGPNLTQICTLLGVIALLADRFW